MRSRLLFVLTAAVACARAAQLPTSGPALPGDFSDSVTNVAPGVTWHRMHNAAGPWNVNLVAIDLRRCDCTLRAVRAKDSLVARERVSAMAARQPDAGRVLAAINADFFDVKTGENENNQVIDGEWWKGMRVTDSPYDAFPSPHAQFAVGPDGKPRIDLYMLDGAVSAPGVHAFPLTALNFLARRTLEAAVLYTPRFGSTPRDTARKVAEVRLRAVRGTRDSGSYVVVAPPATSGGHRIAVGEVVLAAYGARATTVAKFRAGDTLTVVMRAATHAEGSGLSPQLLLGGWPRILAAGAIAAERAPWVEGTLSSNAEARHPRSAVGISSDSGTLYIATVDGRSEDSGGMTLIELAFFMRDRGARDALNFDGGGSTTMIVRDRVVNAPSDKEGERPVGNALLVVQRSCARGNGC
jgi:hypothetical protein